MDPTPEMYRRITESAPVAIFQVDADGRFRYVNEAAPRILGYSGKDELIAVGPVGNLLADPGDAERLLGALGSGAYTPGHVVDLRRADGRVVTCRLGVGVVRSASGDLLYYEGAFEDVTTQVRLEAELLTLRRLEAARRVVGALTHSLSNALTGALANLQIARDATAASPQSDDLAEAERSILTAVAILAKLQSFTAVAELSPRTIDLSGFVRVWVDEHDTPPGISLVAHVLDGPMNVHADPSTLDAVLSHLFANALEAVAATDRREGTIRIRVTAADEPGDVVELAVIDDGIGMSDHTREHATEPFFTLRRRRASTSGAAGLGLPYVAGLVHAHGGRLRIESALGEGTTVRILLPRHPLPADAAVTRAEE